MGRKNTQGGKTMRFFLGIRLPPQLEEIIEGYRRDFRAPLTVAHITVLAPFDWDRSIEELKLMLQNSLQNSAPFKVQGAGIGSFGTRVLFVNVELTPELKVLQQNLVMTFKKENIAIDSRTYNPHITLASRLSPEQFSRYEQKLHDFKPEYAFYCSTLTLFKFTAARRWQEYYQIHL